MSIQQTVFRTISCNGPNCKNSVTFPLPEEQATLAKPENSWARTLRIVATLDNRNFAYCSDKCEVESVATGIHNIPEPKAIVEGNAASVAQAALAAEQAKSAEAALRSGQGGQIQIASR